MTQQHAATLPGGLFEQAQCGVALLDDNGRVSWANPTLGQMLGLGSEELLGQHTHELPDKAALLLGGESGPVQLLDPQGSERWLQRDPATDASLCLVQDVTEQQRLSRENERLRQQVAELKLTDDLTGLPNKRAITQAMELQISRSRRYKNPLSLVMVHVGLEEQVVAQIDGSVDPLILGVARFLRDRLRWVDQIGRWEDNIFVLVLPETEKQHADGLVQKIQDELPGLQLPQPFEGIQPVLSFGVACWQKGDDMRTLLRQVTQDLQDD